MEAVLPAPPAILDNSPPSVLLAPGDEEDAVLVAKAQNGSTQAFESLVVRYRNKIYAMIMNMTSNDADAWDLSQEVFVKAWRALGKFEARSQFYTWLYRIAHNVTLDWLRKRRIQPGTEFDDALQAAPAAGATTVPRTPAAPDVALHHQEMGKRIHSALQELRPEHRSAILLKEIEGLTYQEISDSLGCSIGTVMSRIFYARKRLQALLQDVYANMNL